MTKEDALGHNNALQQESKEGEIKEQRQKGGSLNPFNDALYIAFLGQVVHHHASVTDFHFQSAYYRLVQSHLVGLFWTFTAMLPA